MPATDAKADLSLYLQFTRDALLWKLTGLSEYDVRRPLTFTGTNLLGLVKHATAVELGYLGSMNEGNLSTTLLDAADRAKHQARLEHLRPAVSPKT